MTSEMSVSVVTEDRVVSTAACADACMTLGVPVRIAPGVRPITAAWHAQGPAVPVVHLASVDVILEAIDAAQPGSVLVIDDRGRQDRACIGDLIALEAKSAGVAGLVVWGSHRDTAQLLEIGLPVFSLGAHPSGPDPAERVDPAPPHLATHALIEGDIVVADADGVILLPGERAEQVMIEALAIQAQERAQATRMREGTSLRAQLGFDEYLQKRREDATYTLRRHLRERGGAIER